MKRKSQSEWPKKNTNPIPTPAHIKKRLRLSTLTPHSWVKLKQLM